MIHRIELPCRETDMLWHEVDSRGLMTLIIAVDPDAPSATHAGQSRTVLTITREGTTHRLSWLSKPQSFANCAGGLTARTASLRPLRRLRSASSLAASYASVAGAIAEIERLDAQYAPPMPDPGYPL